MNRASVLTRAFVSVPLLLAVVVASNVLVVSGAIHVGTRIVSVAPDGSLGNGNSLSVAINGDGTRVAFASQATNLVPGDTNEECLKDDPRFPPRNCTDIFLRDLNRGDTQRISVAANGSQADGYSDNPVVNSDGTTVGFASFAGNLVPGDRNGVRDIFVYDGAGKPIERVSVASNGAEQGAVEESSCGYACGGVSLSGDGRYVVFDSWSDNLVGLDLNKAADVFLHDRASRQTVRVSVDSMGKEADDASWKPGPGALSTDGRVVVFHSVASNLDLRDKNTCPVAYPFPQGKSCLDVYARNLETGTTWLVSVGLHGQSGNGNSSLPYISGNGHFVAFSSDASDLVPRDTNQRMDVFVRNLETEVTERISASAQGEEGNGDSWFPSISADGRFVTFDSAATNLVAGDTNGAVDVFVVDRDAHSVHRASRSSAGDDGNGLSALGRISGNGEVVAFYSEASNLVQGDANGVADVFASDHHSLSPSPSGTLAKDGGESRFAPYAAALGIAVVLTTLVLLLALSRGRKRG